MIDTERGIDGAGFRTMIDEPSRALPARESGVLSAQRSPSELGMAAGKARVAPLRCTQLAFIALSIRDGSYYG